MIVRLLHTQSSSKLLLVSFVSSLTISDDDRFVYAGFEFAQLMVFDLQAKTKLHHLKLDLSNGKQRHLNEIRSLAVTADCRFIAAASKSNLTMFDLRAQKEVYQFNKIYGQRGLYESEREIVSVSISSNKKFIVAATTIGIMCFDTYTRKQLYIDIASCVGSVSAVVLSRDDNFLIYAMPDTTILVFELSTQKYVHKLEKVHKGKIAFFSRMSLLTIFKGSIKAIAVSCGNKFIISGSRDKTIKVFNFQSGELHHTFENVHDRKISLSTNRSHFLNRTISFNGIIQR